MPRKNFSKSEPRSTPTDTHDNPVVAAMSLFVRWARRELHGQTVAQSGIDIDRSAATILGALYFHEPVRLSDLADHLGLDRSTISAKSQRPSHKAGCAATAIHVTHARRC